MSEPVSALNHLRFSDGIATIKEVGPVGMLTIRGDLSRSFLKKAVTKVSGHPMPGQREIANNPTHALAWMSSDELLMTCPYGDVAAHLKKLTDAFEGKHTLVANVSDARAVFQIKGKYVREVLAKLAPVDLAPEVFRPGMIRRTRLAQVPAAFWMVDAETAHLVCFRSVAQYVFDLLKTAAQPGSEVGFYRR